ncbi:unnamed protein product [Rhizopus microsporus]
MDITQTLVSTSTAHMGKEENEDRCLRIENQSRTSDLLEPSSRPIGDSNRCVSTELVEQRFVFESTVEIDPQGNTMIMLDQGSRHGPDHSTVVDTSEIDHPTDKTEDKKLDFDRLEVIKRKREDGIAADTQDFLNQQIRPRTSRSYGYEWHVLLTSAITISRQSEQ